MKKWKMSYSSLQNRNKIYLHVAAFGLMWQSLKTNNSFYWSIYNLYWSELVYRFSLFLEKLSKVDPISYIKSLHNIQYILLAMPLSHLLSIMNHILQRIPIREPKIDYKVNKDKFKWWMLNFYYEKSYCMQGYILIGSLATNLCILGTVIFTLFTKFDTFEY